VFRGLFRNAWLWLAAAAALAAQAAVIHLPALQRAFGTVALDAGDWLLCAGVGFTLVIARETCKAWWRNADRRSAAC
jgi:hypothetical protein